MLKLATILQNPAEPTITSRYSDPHELRKLGYNGLVFYQTTGLSGISNPDEISDNELRRWVVRQRDQVREHIRHAREAELEVYLSYDVLSLARQWVERAPSTVTCLNHRHHLCPASDEALTRSRDALEGLLSSLPPVDGVTIRFGDSEAERLPHLIGNEIYSPDCKRCERLSHAQRVCRVLHVFYDLVVTRFNQRLIARAWNVHPRGLHDSVQLCRQIVEGLPGDPGDDRLVFSFKFTHTDFWRYQRWNPCSLVMGDRPVLYELQCQREFEAKGAIPNWQVPLWRDHAPELAPEHSPDRTKEKTDDGRSSDALLGGLAHVTGKIRWAGLWAWVRGGGWGGPFIKDETWVDANVFAVPRLVDDPQTPSDQLARVWIHERLGTQHPPTVQILTQILEHSTQIVLNGFYLRPLARTRPTAWNPNDGWIQDDLIDTQAAWEIVQQLPESSLDEVVHEKQQAVDRISTDRVALQNLLDTQPNAVLEPLVNHMIYAESLLTALCSLWAGLIAYRRFQSGLDPSQAQRCHRWIASAQSHWNHHTQRHGALAGNATVFRESGFWELTQTVLQEVHGKFSLNPDQTAKNPAV